jgi:hypothetical protein
MSMQKRRVDGNVMLDGGPVYYWFDALKQIESMKEILAQNESPGSESDQLVGAVLPQIAELNEGIHKAIHRGLVDARDLGNLGQAAFGVITIKETENKESFLDRFGKIFVIFRMHRGRAKRLI